MLIVAITALALLLILLTLSNVRSLRRVPVIPERQQPADSASVSIIIPARNEARVIERCVRGALSQAYADYELIVVDDGSTDGTAAILQRLQRANPALHVVQSGPLQAGWKGKQHALSAGYALAQGEWLLFLDADTAPRPALLPSLVAFAESEGVDMLTALPHLELGSFWERAILPAFASLVSAVFPLWEVNDQHSQVAMANGQCIFIRRSTYEVAGTHAAIRGEIAEDVALARRVKATGARLFMADARRLISVRMYHNGREVVEGLTKNAMAGVEIGGLRALHGTARQTVLAIGPFLLGLLVYRSHRPAGTRRAGLTESAALASCAITVWGWCHMYRRIFALPARYGLLYPLGIAAYGLIGLYSALRLRFGQGVVWKGRRYEDIQ